jgi:hypothetical protein
MVGALIVAALASLALTTGHSVALTLPAVVILATACTLGTGISYAALSSQQGPTVSAALSEATSAGSGVGCLAPLAVAATTGFGWGWRPAVGLTVLIGMGVAAVFTRLPGTPVLDGDRARTVAPSARTDGGAAQPSAPPLPEPARSRMLLGAFVAVNTLAVMTEMAAVFWAAQLLLDQTGVGHGAAAAAVTAFVAGLTAGRLVSGPLSVRHSPTWILIAGLAIVAAGWFAVWTTSSFPVGVAALFAMGAGTAPGFPFGNALTLRHSPLGPETSMAILLCATGIGGSLGPVALGWLGDRLSVHQAYAAIPVMVLAELVAAVVALAGFARLRKPDAPHGH